MFPSGVPSTKEGDAATISQKIVDMLAENEVDIQNIAGLVFDTTSANSGHLNGIVVRLEAKFSHKLLQLACHHHIPELICGAACKNIYGDTESLNESCFVALAKAWSGIDKTKYQLPVIEGRFLSGLKTEVVNFLTDFMAGEGKSLVREDYKELALLSLLFLGGTTPSGTISIIAPGAYHHARWMAKVLYTVKIAIFRDQLGDVFDKEDLDMIVSLATFLVLFYVRYWFCCPSAPDAAPVDLGLMKLFESASNALKKDLQLLEFVTSAREKLQAHLWYLSERLVPLALFSSRVSDREKSDMAKAILRCKSEKAPPSQEMPNACNFKTKKLKDFVGPDSWTFFSLFEVEPSFLKLPVPKWSSNEDFVKLAELARSLKVTNDSAERVLGVLTEFHVNKITKDEGQRQSLLQVIKEVRLRQKALAEGQNMARYDKNMLKRMKYT